MVIGIDGSRAFVKNRTGTEEYSYQLLRNLANIDQENNYIIYVRPNTSLRVKDEAISDSGQASPVTRSGNGARMTENGSQIPLKARLAFGGKPEMTVEGWPGNFKFVEVQMPRLWTQVGLAWRTFIDQLDLLFVPSHTLPLVRKPGLKTVMTVHDLGAEYLPSSHQLKQRLYLDFITKFQLKSATKLIAVSNATKKDLVGKVGMDSKRIEVIYEGAKTQDLRSKIRKACLRSKDQRSDIEVDILSKFDIKNGKYFLFVGTIQPRKNLVRLIKAFKGFLNVVESGKGEGESGWKLVLAGRKGWLSDEIYGLSKQLGIEDRVVFTGRVSDDELSTLLYGARALVFPSLFEGFGLPILEAYHHGTPVLTSNISSTPEVAGDAAILVNPFKVEEILDGMVKLAFDDDLRDNLIEKGNIQLKRFSWEKAAQETLKVFQDI